MLSPCSLQGLHKSLTPALIEDVEEYVEGLYEEDLAARTAAAGAISLLFRSVNNFEVTSTPAILPANLC
jgi:hypothetical protein